MSINRYSIGMHWSREALGFPHGMDPDNLASLTSTSAIAADFGWWFSASAIGSIRLWDTGVSWRDLEPERGKWKFYRLDQIIDRAEENNVEVLLVLGSTPEWAARDPDPADIKGTGSASYPRRLKYWDEYVRTIVSRYAGRIDAYQIYNEVDLDIFWTGTAIEMAILVKRANDIINEIDPNAKVVLPSVTTRTNAGMNFMDLFLPELSSRSWPFDCWSYHGYPPGTLGSANLSACAQVTGHDNMRKKYINKIFNYSGAPYTRPIWETEINYGMVGPVQGASVQYVGTESASMVYETYMRNNSGSVAKTFWYAWVPESDLLGIETYYLSTSPFYTAAVKGIIDLL